jgi:hypothetical protein
VKRAIKPLEERDVKGSASQEPSSTSLPNDHDDRKIMVHRGVVQTPRNRLMYSYNMTGSNEFSRKLGVGVPHNFPSPRERSTEVMLHIEISCGWEP